MRLLVVAIVFNFTSVYSQDITLGWTKANTANGSEFKKYESQTSSFFLKYRKPFTEDITWGLGLEVLEFRKPAVPERLVKMKGLFGEIGYFFRQIPGLTLLGSTSVGIMQCEYEFIDPPSELKGSKGIGISLEPSVSFLFPLTKKLTFTPSIGYLMVFDQMGFKSTDSKQPVGKLDSHMFATTYRLALSWRLRKE
ncbi:hypothetical protein L6Q79_02820 [bacterium]|nr:hypothetical protein [bacterium]NUN44760.1 hypothetical protein [bacterium]